MKTLHLGIIIGTGFLFSIFLIASENAYAYTCAVKSPSLTAQYYYLHSGAVFVGTVSSITNNTNHQFNVKFDIEKSWKGSQHPTITTYGLVACGYSLVKGEKYLVFATGYPLDYDPWATKPFDTAKDDITLLDSPQFQAQANTDEELYKRLVNARDAISNMMGSKMSQMPISSVGVNDLNFTLDVGIADKKAVLPSGSEEYKQKIEKIVGNVPIRVQYEEYATALPEIITQHTALSSPLKQFKSGIDPYHVICRKDLQLLIKLKENSPACVKSTSLARLLEQGWINAYDRNGKYDNNGTQTQTSDSSSVLKLYFSTSSQVIQPGQPIGITISVNNTLSRQVTVQDENSWKLDNLNVNPCTTAPYGIAIFDGFYSEKNMTDGKPLTIFNFDANCPAYIKTTQTYVFHPSSGHVTLNNCTDTQSTCASGYDMGNQFSFTGTLDTGQITPFNPGIYTIVGGDEWGHVAIEHFVVTNSTIFAGDLGTIHCLPTFGGVQFGATIKNSAGFVNYYNSTQYGHTFFFLHPKMQGTINVQYTSPVDAAWFQNNNNAPFNVINGATLFYMANATNGKMITSYAVSLYNDETGHHSRICHYGIPYGGFAEPCNSDNKGDIPPSELSDASKLLHPGISTLSEPNSVMLYPNSNPVFTASVSANSDAMPGTYWLSLGNGLCGPGVLAKLVVLP